MSIVIIGPVYPYRGGIAHYTTMLTKALSARHEVHVISFKSQYPSWLYPGKSDRDPSQVIFQTDAEYLLTPFNPWTWLHTANYIKVLKPELVILQHWTTYWSPAFGSLGILLKRINTPLLYIIHNIYPHERHLFDTLLSYYALKQGDAFICQSDKEANTLRKIFPHARVTIIPHPVYEMFNKAIPKEKARQVLNLPQDKPIILFFGIVRKYKGLQFLLEAIAYLKYQGRQVYLVVAGEFWDKTNYMKQITQLQIADLVRLEDRYIPNEEVPFYFSAADVFVAPYTGGTQSGAVKIALAYGLPCVVTAAIASSEFTQKSTTPVKVVPSGNSLALAQAILECESHFSFSKGSFYSDPGWIELVKLIEIMHLQQRRLSL
ncbi:MAG: glycosyltransferase [Candidatus Hadarchaeum sp.]